MRYAILDGCANRCRSLSLGNVICIRSIATEGPMLSVAPSMLYTRPSSSRILALPDPLHTNLLVAFLPFQLYLSACHHELPRGIGKLVHELVERDLGQRPYSGDPPRACACCILCQVHCNCRTSAAACSAITTALGERPSGKCRGQMHAGAIHWQHSSLSRESRNSS